MIQHLVISGGGAAGLLTYGAAQQLAKEGFWHLKNIKSIYGCSIGAYLAIILSLGYAWEWLDDYFIERPWEKVVQLTAVHFLAAFDQKGLMDATCIEESLSPLLSAKHLSAATTLAEYFAYNQIELHIFTTNINSPGGQHLEKVDLSYLTHPDLSLITALSMSMAYPLAFKPVCLAGACYIDGGLLTNFPLNDCITQTQCNKDDILAFKNMWIPSPTTTHITEESSLIDFLMATLSKMARAISSEEKQEEVKNTVRCLVEDLNGLPSWFEAVSTKEMRAKLVERGRHQGKLFLSYKTGTHQ
jgi:predicted acylesterase/phospholipase RssA